MMYNQQTRTALRLRSQMSSAPSSEPATTHLPCGSVVENAAKTQYLLFLCPAVRRAAGVSGAQSQGVLEGAAGEDRRDRRGGRAGRLRIGLLVL